MNVISILSLTLCIMIGKIIAPENSYGYIDPGIGSLMWQLILAGFFGASFFIHKFRQCIINSFKSILKRFKD